MGHICLPSISWSRWNRFAIAGHLSSAFHHLQLHTNRTYIQTHPKPLPKYLGGLACECFWPARVNLFTLPGIGFNWDMYWDCQFKNSEAMAKYKKRVARIFWSGCKKSGPLKSYLCWLLWELETDIRWSTQHWVQCRTCCTEPRWSSRRWKTWWRMVHRGKGRAADCKRKKEGLILESLMTGSIWCLPCPLRLIHCLRCFSRLSQSLGCTGSFFQSGPRMHTGYASLIPMRLPFALLKKLQVEFVGSGFWWTPGCSGWRRDDL